MAADEEQAPVSEGGGIPVDPRTLMVGLWRRRKLLLLVLVLAPLMGLVAGKALGKRTYEAETVLLYQASPWARGGTAEAPSLRTSVNMVKIQSNLEATRKHLGLSASLTTLASVFEVQVQKETTLLSIRARWDNAEEAAELANTLRDVYLQSQIRVRREDARQQIQDLETRLETVEKQLTEADTALQKYVADHHIVDLDKELNRYLEEYTSMDILYQQSLAEQKTINEQASNIDKIIGDLKAKVAQEESSTTQMESLGDLNIRSQRLRESIHDDKESRNNMVDLARAKVDLERAELLLTKGAISQAEVEQARATYHRQETVTLDTPQIKAWKDELARIDRTVLPKSSGSTPSAPILKDMLMKQFAVQLDKVSLGVKVEHLQAARQRIKQQLETRAGLQQGYQELVREISSKEVDKKALEASLAQARRAQESQNADFTVIAQAEAPPQPIKSNRKLVFLGVSAVFALGGLGLVLALELTDPTLKSPAQASLRLRLPVLAALPRIPAATQRVDHPVFDTLRLLARRLDSPKGGRRVLLTSGTQGEGTSFVAEHLAACLERQEKTVLLIDCSVRRAGQDESRGLSDLLEGSGADLEEAIRPGPLPRLYRLGPGRAPGVADRLGSPRMSQLLDQASRRFDVVLLDCPGLSYVESDLLARWVDEVVLVVQARGPHMGLVQRALTRLAAGGARMAGLILNQVDVHYLEGTGASL